MASRLLHRHIREQLKDLVEILQDPLPPPLCLPSTPGTPGFSDPSHVVGSQACWSPQKEVTHESLVVGAIENAFQLMVSGWVACARQHCVVGVSGWVAPRIHTTSESLSRTWSCYPLWSFSRPLWPAEAGE